MLINVSASPFELGKAGPAARPDPAVRCPVGPLLRVCEPGWRQRRAGLRRALDRRRPRRRGRRPRPRLRGGSTGLRRAPERWSGHDRRAPTGAPKARRSEALKALELGLARLPGENRIRKSRSGAVRRHRLGADCGRRQPGPRAGPGARGRPADPLLLPGQPDRRRGAGDQPRHRVPADLHRRHLPARTSIGSHRSSRAVAEDVTEENIQARIRGARADGALQQARPHAARHRQQVGAGGRLRHALRRHVRGAGGDLADVSKTLVYRLALHLNARHRGHSCVAPRPSLPQPSCGRTRPIRTACRRTTCSTEWSGSTSSGIGRWTKSSGSDWTGSMSSAWWG